MTINELCNKQEKCGKCPFYDACNILYQSSPFRFDVEYDELVTKSIIETANTLEGDNND